MATAKPYYCVNDCRRCAFNTNCLQADAVEYRTQRNADLVLIKYNPIMSMMLRGVSVAYDMVPSSLAKYMEQDGGCTIVTTE